MGNMLPSAAEGVPCSTGFEDEDEDGALDEDADDGAAAAGER